MNNIEIRELGDLVGDLGTAFKEFRDENDRRIEALENALARGEFPGGGFGSSGSNQVAIAKEYKEKFFGWVRKGGGENQLRDLEVQANLSTLSDPDGGFLVPVEIEKSIERLAQTASAMRRIARIVTARGEYTKPLSKGGATGGWVSEKESRPETNTPTLNLFSPPMCEVYAMPSVTQKLLDMSDFDVESWLLDEIFDAFAALEGAGFITGNGVSRVKGLIDEALMVANSSWSYGKTGFIVSGDASLLTNPDKLIDLQHALKPIYRQNGTFLMNDSTFAVIRKLKDLQNNYLWSPGLTPGAPDILLGKPVEIDENMPNIGASAYPIAFGDFKRAYTIVDHASGIRVLRDPYTTKGFVNFYTIKRVAAGISNYEAVKFLKIAA